MSFLQKVLAILAKDIQLEFRTKEMLSAMLIFALLVVVIFSFAFDVTSAGLREVFPGMLWVAFFFAGVLGLNRSFASEQQNAAIQGLMLAPMDRSAIYFAKVIGNFIFMMITEAVALPVFLVLFDYRFSGSFPVLVLVLVMSTFGFIAVGTFLSALAANTRTSEILLPIILFPVLVPVVIAAVQTTRGVFSADPLSTYALWFKVLAAYDFIFLVVPFLLFDYVLEG